ncbi:MAG: lysophospholipid acyltransferase family protein [Deltaproteobacteria bacterium]|uniref:Lysophospholipid acyltransferase family protein n=1 Tax=Candidatus Zymogenus saltonus TaxID=2844893 RepID=A0A9D8KBT3_9DELT|nr:lysophospholipid acyltransferase family protein [Candidatus Zymogenus saltonus]
MSGKRRRKRRKRRRRFLKNHIEPRIYSLLMSAIPFIPLGVVRLLSYVMFAVFYPTIGVFFGLRRKYIKNITKAYRGVMRGKEIRAVARKGLRHLITENLEFMYYYHPRNRDRMLKNIKMTGIENLERAREMGKGVIGFGMHLGSFQLLCVRLSLKDIDFTILIKRPKYRNMAAVWVRLMDKIGMKRIWISGEHRAGFETATEIFAEIESGRSIMFIADEFKRVGGIRANIFGRPTYIAGGPAVGSLRTGAPILPILIVRGKKGRYEIFFEEPIVYRPTGDKDRDIEALTQGRADIIERYVKLYPEQWFWFHSHWKGVEDGVIPHKP